MTDTFNLSLDRRSILKTAPLAAGGSILLSGLASSSPASAADSGRRFVANFVFAYSTLEANKNMFKAMNTDAINFGGTLRYPQSGDGIPQSILKHANGRRVFYYTSPLTWYQGQGAGHVWLWDNSLADGKRYAWDMVVAGNSVVISKNNGVEHTRHMIAGAQQTGYRAYVGLPKPQMQSKATWLADSSYLDVYQAFCEKFVTNYNALGAAGYYHTLEMTVSDNFDSWRPTWDTYWAGQRAIRNMSGHGKTSIFSPYLESRSNKAFKTPQQVAYAARWFNDLTYGTNLVISPQDGLGTGTTSLRADNRSGYVAKTEDYFSALKPVLGRSLYATTECMTPGGGTPATRGVTTKSRISQQLYNVGTYTQGHIGYMWNHGTYGMIKVPGLGSSWSAGSGRLG